MNPNPPQADTQPRWRYNAALANSIEPRWQSEWAKAGAFRQPNPGEPGFDASKPKFYCLDMFPYPSGAGLHVGHPEGYTATDIICRLRRMQGYNVLHPMGWDAFGLPAEQYAIQTGIHPAITTRQSIDNFRRQLQRFGFSYDWSREFGTIDEDYYRWTQWIFLRLYNAWFDTAQAKARHIDDLIAEFASGARPPRLSPHASEYSAAGDFPDGTPIGAWETLDEDTRRMIVDSYRLAYVALQTVNWCPKLGTVLANDEVIDGRSERGGYPVYRKPLRQWMFRITAFAQRLLDGLETIDWPEATKTQQREWIGRSEGAEVDFSILDPGGPSLRGGSASSSIPGGPSLRGGSASSSLLGGPSLGGGASGVLAQLLRAFDLQHLQACDPVGFEPRDPYPPGIRGSAAELIKHQRKLPHLELPGATYFVTWKTWKELPLSPEERGMVMSSLRFFDGSRCRVYAAVVMSNHVHWIVKPSAGESLDEIVKSVKRFSASEINSKRAARGQLWDDECFDHIIRDVGYFNEYVHYVVFNPVEAGVVSSPLDYPSLFVHEDTLGVPNSEAATEWRPTPTGMSLRIFTTRPDTIFGATYMVVAPEHPLVDQALSEPGPETPVEALRHYVQQARNRSDIDRQESHDKTGVFTGVYCLNPATNKPIPVWTSDYVLMGYGTGAIMAVPGQDQRDWDFAKIFDLPIIRTVQPPPGFEGQAYLGDGPAINSSFLDGLHMHEAKARIIEWLEERSLGVRRVNYRLRDWTFSRQRYWGEPIPIVFDERGRHYPLAPDRLPLKLPELADYAPIESDDPQALLAKAREWMHTTAAEAGVEELPPETPMTREANTMPGSAGSSWYFLRYCDARNQRRFVGADAEKYWMNVDLYLGGNEHAVGHLLYSRFWQQALFDLGEVSTPEPFQKLFHQGLILSHAYQRADKTLVPVDQVVELRQQPDSSYVEVFTQTGRPFGGTVDAADLPEHVHAALQHFGAAFVEVGPDGDLSDSPAPDKHDVNLVTQIVAKMSKSLKNVVNPDEIIADYGADTFRLYEMYMGPLEASKPWNTRDIAGLFRFLQRLWRLLVDEDTGHMVVQDGAADPGLEKLLHRLIAKAASDIERLAFNTAIAAMIEFVNYATAQREKGGPRLTRSQAQRLALVVCPFAPHIAEELWRRLGGQGLASLQRWPTHDEAMLKDDAVEIAIQVMGKVRHRMLVPTGADAAAVEQAVLAEPKVVEILGGKPVKKVVVVPGRMVNIVHG